jgi:cytochrome P450
MAADITLGGHGEIEEGQPLLILVGRANRDPAMFSHPLEFDPWRAEMRNLAFGAGSRRCPGIYLARIQLRAALSAMVRHVPELSLAAAPTWTEALHCERLIQRLTIRTETHR